MVRETNDDRRRRRLEKQRLRQQELRAEKARKRTPGRDDFARELLHFAITENLRSGREQELNHLADNLIAKLVERGFDRTECERVIVDIIDRYEGGWGFQRKVWQRPPSEGDGTPGSD
jgi:hypothetical protein